MGPMDSMNGNGNQPVTNHMSWSIAILIVVILLAVMVHVWYTFHQQRAKLHQEGDKHVSVGIHLTMAISMMGGFCIGTVIGGLANQYVTLAYLIGIVVGSLIGFVIGFPFQHLAIIDGMISGLMGGTMGVMMGVMIEPPGLYTILFVLTLLFVITWAIILHYIRDQINKRIPTSSEVEVSCSQEESQ